MSTLVPRVSGMRAPRWRRWWYRRYLQSCTGCHNLQTSMDCGVLRTLGPWSPKAIGRPDSISITYTLAGPGADMRPSGVTPRRRRLIAPRQCVITRKAARRIQNIADHGTKSEEADNLAKKSPLLTGSASPKRVFSAKDASGNAITPMAQAARLAE